MYMYGRKEIRMLLTTNMAIMNGEGNAQKKVSKFPILKGKSSQQFKTVFARLGKFPTSSQVPWNIVTLGTSFVKFGSDSRAS